MEPWVSGRTLIRLWWLWLCAAVIIVWLANSTSLDIRFADSAFDVNQHAFTLKHNVLLETVMHSYAKTILTIFWILLLLLAYVPSEKLPVHFSASTIYALRWITVLALVNAVVISCLKHQMPHACPWDIARYGGASPWVPTFSSHPAMQAGHCFPAGHATSGVWLSALCLLWLPQAPRKALLVAIAGLTVGFMLGWAQQLRGAHFLSHTLTSLWLMCGWLLMVFTFSKSRRS
ncbi:MULTISPECIES: phosphatase PAP2 family protein [unclassified Methylophilus]|uniref:phosphatase PAP2 family protein n=1 Tax=unclassified Methylophilus TaxID=2630143 RepID=UPI00035D2BF6|nr:MULTISPECIES: phosphatase PAP2 family protein [unclassified Methylophilus]